MQSAPVIVLVLAACGGARPAPEPEPASGRDSPGVIAQQLFDAQTAMTNAAVANAASCPAMATALDGVFEQVRPLFARATELRANPEYARSLNVAMRPYDDAADTQARQMFEALAGCRQDPAVADAVARMPVLQ